MNTRGSYRRLLLYPAYGLYSDEDKLVATVRAHDATRAAALFRAHGLIGECVKRIGKPKPSDSAPSLTPEEIDATYERLLERYGTSEIPNEVPAELQGEAERRSPGYS